MFYLALNFDKQNRRLSTSSEGFDGDFEDQLLKYNNNKLFIPGLSGKYITFLIFVLY